MTTRRELLLSAPAFAVAPVITSGEDALGETWHDIVARLGRAANALDIPREEVSAILATHGSEVKAWVEGEDIEGVSFRAFIQFCRSQGMSLDWVFFGNDDSLLRFTRVALTR